MQSLKWTLVPYGWGHSEERITCKKDSHVKSQGEEGGQTTPEVLEQSSLSSGIVGSSIPMVEATQSAGLCYSSPNTATPPTLSLGCGEGKLALFSPLRTRDWSSAS